MRPKHLRNFKQRTVLEARVVSETKKAAKAAGFQHRKMKYENRNGAPDSWFFAPGGRLIIIEFKAPKKEPEEHQIREIRKLRDMGFSVFVVDNVEFGKAIFDAY